MSAQPHPVPADFNPPVHLSTAELEYHLDLLANQDPAVRKRVLADLPNHLTLLQVAIAECLAWRRELAMVKTDTKTPADSERVASIAPVDVAPPAPADQPAPEAPPAEAPPADVPPPPAP